MMKPTVFVVEDDAVICANLRHLFKTVAINAEFYSDAKTYLAAHNAAHYGCLLIDIRLPDVSGIKLQEQLIERKNQIPIIIMTSHGDITMAVRAMKLGAIDFLLKPFNNDYLLEQIQKIFTESYEKQKAYQNCASRYSSLTKRETETFKLIVAGMSNKSIAKKLGITLSTVEQHRAHLMQKMSVRSVAELVKNYMLVAPESSFKLI